MSLFSILDSLYFYRRTKNIVLATIFTTKELILRLKNMKFILSILLNILLLLVFTTVPTTYTWACGKDNHKKETSQYRNTSKCQKECCKKSCSNHKNKKKKCCGDNCNCAVSLTVIGDMPTPLQIDNLTIRPVFIVKRAFFFKQSFPKSTVQDIWQPPIIALS